MLQVIITKHFSCLKATRVYFLLMLSVLYGLTESLNSLTLEEADGGIVTILNIAGHCT